MIEFLLLLVLIVLNGFFAMAEIALVTARRARLQVLAEQGDGGALAAIELGQSPTRFLSTVQIGITSIGVLNGIVADTALAQPVARWLMGLGVAQQWAQYVGTGLAVLLITYCAIVLGELVPKRIGQLYPEVIARLFARPMVWLALATTPFVKALTTSTELILKAIGAREKDGPAVTEEEIHALLAEGSESGAIEQHEHQMVRNVFRLDDRQISSLMIPRSDIVWLDADASTEENIRRVLGSAHARFPVCRGGWGEVLGMVHTKELLVDAVRGEALNFHHGLHAVAYVPETLTAMELLHHFRRNGARVSLVIDEYGEIQGMVTVQDVLEAITGEFETENAEDAWAVQRDDGSWWMDGLIPIPEMKDCLRIKEVPEEDKGRYNTLSGMLMLLLGRVPQTGDVVEWDGWRFEIADMDGKRIDKVWAQRCPGAEAGD